MLKTILLLLTMLLLSSCTSTKDEKTLVEAPKLINLQTSTTKQEIQVQIKTLADVSIYLNDKYVVMSDENGDASIELKLDTSTSFTHFTLKVKQEDTFSKSISFSVEYLKKKETTEDDKTNTDQNQTQDDKTSTDKKQDDKTNTEQNQDDETSTDQNQTQDDKTNTDQTQNNATNTDQNQTITNPKSPQTPLHPQKNS